MTDFDSSSFDLLVDLPSYSDEELKELSTRLQEEEQQVSKRRRLLHAKIDLLRAEMVRRMRDKHHAGQSLFSEGDVDTLSSILSGRGLPPREE